jgi:hypothetical protein
MLYVVLSDADFIQSVHEVRGHQTVMLLLCSIRSTRVDAEQVIVLVERQLENMSVVPP